MRRSRKGFTVVELAIVIGVLSILAAVIVPNHSALIGKAEDAVATYNARMERYERLLSEPETKPSEPETKPSEPETTASDEPESSEPEPTEPALPQPYGQVKRWNAVLAASERENPTMHDALTELAGGDETKIADIVQLLFAAETQTQKIVWDQQCDCFAVATESGKTVRFHTKPDEPTTELASELAYRLWRVYDEEHDIPYSKSVVPGSAPTTSGTYSAYWAGRETPTCLTEKSYGRIVLEFTVGFDMGLWNDDAIVIKMAAEHRNKNDDCAAMPRMIYRTNGMAECSYYGTSEVAHYGSAGKIRLAGMISGQTDHAYHEYGAIGSIGCDDSGMVKFYMIYLEEGCKVDDSVVSGIKKLYKNKPGNFVDKRNATDTP